MVQYSLELNTHRIERQAQHEETRSILKRHLPDSCTAAGATEEPEESLAYDSRVKGYVLRYPKRTCNK